MNIEAVIPQLRTTNLAASIHFYTTMLGGTLDFQYEDFYAGIRWGTQMIHLKHIDEPDPSIAFVRDGGHLHLYLRTDDVTAAAESRRRSGVPLVCEVEETAWNTRELVIEDDQGHTIYIGAPV